MRGPIYGSPIAHAQLLASPAHHVMELVGEMSLGEVLGGNASVRARVRKDKSLFQNLYNIQQHLNDTQSLLGTSMINLAPNPAVHVTTALQCILDSIDQHPAAAIRKVRGLGLG